MIQPLPFLLPPREHYYYRSMGEGQGGYSYSAGQDPRSQVSLCLYNFFSNAFPFLFKKELRVDDIAESWC